MRLVSVLVLVAAAATLVLVGALPVLPAAPDASNALANVSDAQPTARVSYAGAQLWKTTADTDDKRVALAELRDDSEIAIWGGNTSSLDVLVRAPYRDHVAEVLRNAGIEYEVLMADIQRAIDTENPPPSEEEAELADRKGRLLVPAHLVPRQVLRVWKGLAALGPHKELWPVANWGHRMTWSAYHRLDDIYGYLDYLAQTYPSLCSVQTIGFSVQRRPIKVLKVSGGGATRGAVWVDGGIHAREWISPATVTYIIDRMVENHEAETTAVRSLDWYFAPVLNPDGYEYSHTTDRLWRKNRARAGSCAGTDLNRNFGYQWGGKGASKYPCSETFGGTRAFSEPETDAVQKFVGGGSRARFLAYVSFHSYGQYILYPWGYDRLFTEDHKELHAVGKRAAAAMRAAGGASYTVGPAGDTLYPAAGGSDDWAKGAVGIKYAYTVELRDTGRHGFILPAHYIETTAREGLAAVRVFASAAAASAAAPAA